MFVEDSIEHLPGCRPMCEQIFYILSEDAQTGIVTGIKKYFGKTCASIHGKKEKKNNYTLMMKKNGSAEQEELKMMLLPAKDQIWMAQMNNPMTLFQPKKLRLERALGPSDVSELQELQEKVNSGEVI